MFITNFCLKLYLKMLIGAGITFFCCHSFPRGLIIFPAGAGITFQHFRCFFRFFIKKSGALERCRLRGKFSFVRLLYTMADKIVKGRNFATVVYPESAPDNWQDLLAENFIPAFISPYHDKDLNPTGEPKKPHYHVMIMFDGPVVLDQARSIFSLIGGVGCEMIKSLRGYARYLCHLDNPDKVQYSVDDVRCLCGSDYHGVIGLAVDKYKAIQEMIDFCESNDIYSFYHLVLYARSERFDWFRILCDCGTIMMRNYIKSRKWTSDQGIPFPDIDNSDIDNSLDLNEKPL